MKVFTSILAIAAIASAAATPDMKRRSAVLASRDASDLCGPLDTPMCCGTDVLGLADLSCSSGTSFSSIFYHVRNTDYFLQSPAMSQPQMTLLPTVAPRAYLLTAVLLLW